MKFSKFQTEIFGLMESAPVGQLNVKKHKSESARISLGRFPFDQNFRLAFPKFPCTKWNGIFHQARSILAWDKFKMANLRTFLFLSEFFDDFEFTDDILEDDDDVVMFKKARFFFT